MNLCYDSNAREAGARGMGQQSKHLRGGEGVHTTTGRWPTLFTVVSLPYHPPALGRQPLQEVVFVDSGGREAVPDVEEGGHASRQQRLEPGHRNGWDICGEFERGSGGALHERATHRCLSEEAGPKASPMEAILGL